jgi:prevent-host-death family protein
MTSRKQPSKSSPSSKKRMGKDGSTKKEAKIRQVALAKVKDDLSNYLRLAAAEEIVITRHGRPAGVLIGFETEDDWFDYRVENHPEFLRQIAESRLALQKGLGIRLEDLDPGRPNTPLQPTAEKRGG